MSREDRHLRADAERNRQRLLDAAQTLFSERGLDVGVAEIAERAGVGRGTLFRNFATKEDLIAAIVVQRMHEATALGRALLTAPDGCEALFDFLGGIVGAHQTDRALFEAVGDTFLAHDGIRTAYGEFMATLQALLTRAQAQGTVRVDIGPLDLLMMIKGITVACMAFAEIDDEIGLRQLDLLRGALRATSGQAPLRGKTLTIEDYERTLPKRSAAKSA